MAGAPLAVLAVLTLMLAGCTVPEGLPGPASEQTEPIVPTSLSTDRGGTLRVIYANVGQGDGTVWQLPDGSVIVYDCGPPARDADASPVVGALRSLGMRRGDAIQALVASHGHEDHVGGCEEVLAEYRVLHAYEAWYEGNRTPGHYAAFREQLRREGATLHVLAATPALEGEQPFQVGDALALTPAAEAAGVRARILWPPAWQGRGWEEIEHSSIAVRLSYGNVSFCFQGDIALDQERALAEDDRVGGGCEVYLVGHHGSKYASGEGWLAAMDPEVAVVSFGKNSHGHPSREALCRVQQAGAELYATHRLGTITVSTDGARVTVAPDRPETLGYCEQGVDYWSAYGR